MARIIKTALPRSAIRIPKSQTPEVTDRNFAENLSAGDLDVMAFSE
jgi:hypothetical protein